MANSALGTLLATRLDAVLGTTLAQHPVLLTGAKSHNVAQAASAVHPQDSVIQRGSGQAAEVDARGARLGAAGAARGGASAAGLLAGKGELPGGIQPSARATLSEPARTILALLLSRGDAGAGVQGRMPLWDANAAAAQRGARGAAGGGSVQGGAAGSGAGASQSSQDAAARSATSSNAGQTASTAEANAAARLAAISAGLAGNPPATAQTAASTGADATRLKVPEGMVRMLAQSLGQTVSHSGLFYESHLAQMVFGKRGLGELLKEPQALMGRPGGAQAGGATQTGHASAGSAGNMPGAAGGSASAGSNTGAQASHAMGSSAGMASSPGSLVGASGLAGYSDASASATGTNTSSLNANLPVPGIHPDAAPLVRQQLETLANNAFHWQGEAWPGASMQWEVNEDASRPGTNEPSTWATRLKLQLPSLGEVEARISLAGDQLVVRLVAPESAPVLQEHASILRENLLAGGLTLTDLTVLRQPAVEPGSAGNPPVPGADLDGNTSDDASQSRSTAGNAGASPSQAPDGTSGHGAMNEQGNLP